LLLPLTTPMYFPHHMVATTPLYHDQGDPQHTIIDSFVIYLLSLRTFQSLQFTRRVCLYTIDTNNLRVSECMLFHECRTLADRRNVRQSLICDKSPSIPNSQHGFFHNNDVCSPPVFPACSGSPSPLHLEAIDFLRHTQQLCYPRASRPCLLCSLACCTQAA
jgi:hypothetical protein